MGAPRALALCHNFRGALDFQTGRWAEAEKDLERAVEVYREVGSASGESLSLQRLGVLLTAKGDTERALVLLNDGLAVAERAAMRSHCLTRLYASLLRNRLAAADEAGVKVSLADGLAAAQRHGHCVTCNALLLPEVVRAELSLGLVEDADRHAAELEQTATEFDSKAWTAMAAHARGRVQLAQSALNEAADTLTRAVTTFTAAEQPYEAARCRLVLAECLRQRAGSQDGAAAEAHEQHARNAFEQLGAAGVEL